MVTIAKKGINKSDWDYSECLAFRDYAKKNGMAMRGHNLVWASTDNRNPKWVNEMTNYTALENFMIEYVTTTVQTIGDYPFAWDAINEAVSDNHDEIIKESPWKHIPDFSCKIFKAAKAAGNGT